MVFKRIRQLLRKESLQTSRGYRSKLKKNVGQSLVEFLLIIILFLTIFMFGVQFCYVSIARSLLNVACHGAARSMAVNQDKLKAEKVAEYYLSPVARPENVDVYFTNKPDKFGEAYQCRVGVKLKLLPLPLTYSFFNSFVESQPTSETTYSYTTDFPTKNNLKDRFGNKIRIGESDSFIVQEKEETGSTSWSKWRFTVHLYAEAGILGWAHYDFWRPGGKSEGTLFGIGRNEKEGDPWPEKYYEVMVYWPRTKPTFDDVGVPSVGEVIGSTGSGITKMDIEVKDRTIEHLTKMDSGPPIYKWKILTTKAGQRHKSGGDGYYNIYTWTSMSAD